MLFASAMILQSLQTFMRYTILRYWEIEPTAIYEMSMHLLL